VELLVPTLEDDVKLKIPEGTQTGAVFRLRGKGVAILGERGRGDQFVTVSVVIPAKLTREQRRLYEELDKLSNDEEPVQPQPQPQPQGEKNIFDKVKDIFG